MRKMTEANLAKIGRAREAKMRRSDHPWFDNSEEEPEIDPSDLEDLRAPHGRCAGCRAPFGVEHKGFIVYKAFSQDSDLCTECVYWELRGPSRDDDERYNRRKK